MATSEPNAPGHERWSNVPVSRWEHALLIGFLTCMLAYALTILISATLEFSADTASRTAGSIIIIAATFGLCIIAFLSFTTFFYRRRHLLRVPPVFMLALAAYAVLIGGGYDQIARNMLGHPLPRLGQLAPGPMLLLQFIAPPAVVALLLTSTSFAKPSSHIGRNTPG
jgi:hypothetical protein